MSLEHDTITLLGKAYHRSGDVPFGMRLPDRLQHSYVIGQTGTGKSTLLHNMGVQDARLGTGFCLIDPHGDLAASVAGSSAFDGVYWRIADPASPHGYNPLMRTSPALRPLVASGLIETLKKQWSDAWGARMEHLLRYAILALLDQPKADMQDILRLFLEKEFRTEVLARTTDSQVLQFWMQEFPSMNYKNAIDGVAPIANKLGAFLANPIVRQAICDPKEPLRFRKLMDEGRPLVINLEKGRLGSDTANVLGGLIVSAITNAAFTRGQTSTRRPFLLYIDEFHNLTTDSLADTLSETRKYGLGLILSQQHCQQSSKDIFAGIMGNVGTLIAFRVGVLDAPLISKQLGLQRIEDLSDLPNHRIFLRMMHQGERTRLFSAQTFPPEVFIQ